MINLFWISATIAVVAYCIRFGVRRSRHRTRMLRERNEALYERSMADSRPAEPVAPIHIHDPTPVETKTGPQDEYGQHTMETVAWLCLDCREPCSEPQRLDDGRLYEVYDGLWWTRAEDGSIVRVTTHPIIKSQPKPEAYIGYLPILDKPETVKEAWSASRQWEEAISILRREPRAPVVIAGDLNYPSDHGGYSQPNCGYCDSHYHDTDHHPVHADLATKNPAPCAFDHHPDNCQCWKDAYPS